MDYHLHDVKSSPEPVQIYYQLNPWEQISVESW